MINIALVLTSQYRLLSVAAILDVFQTVNKLYLESTQPQPFNIILIEAAHQQQNKNTFFNFQTELLKNTPQQDLILVPAFSTDNIGQAILENKAYIPWLRQQYQQGAEIATFCTGAFLLGSTGLLDGKVATTHVDACNAFASSFPSIVLRADKTVTEDGRLYTSGGATSTFNLLMHLLHKHCGKDIAVKVAKVFAIDMDRDKQSYFSTFQPSRDHNDELVATMQIKIETSYNDAATIEEIIKDIPASRRNIVRRFKQVTGITPIEYLQQTRIEAAKKLLERTAQQMTEVIYNSGYNDSKAFRRVFRKTVGMTPSQYREKFQVN